LQEKAFGKNSWKKVSWPKKNSFGVREFPGQGFLSKEKQANDFFSRKRARNEKPIRKGKTVSFLNHWQTKFVAKQTIFRILRFFMD
jgi:hypothetical protein